MKKAPYIALAIIAAAFTAAGAAENKALSDIGLTPAALEIPTPAAPKSNQWNTLHKISVNTSSDMNDAVIGMVGRRQDIDKVLSELAGAGFKVKAYQDGLGGYMVLADVSGQNAADRAVGLARYYYITEVKVSRKVYDDIFGLGNKSRSSYAVKQGSITGGMNHSPVDVKIDKVNWTITGGINLSPVDVKIDNDAMTIKGGANHSPVDLKFSWSPEEVTVDGGANHSPVRYTVNWKNGLLEGYANHAPLKLEFNMDEGNADARTVTVTGYANRAPVELTYDKVSGRITGGMDRSPVDITLVNCDLYDFLQYFFLFVGEQA
ncbi:MAG: hypothetical protein M0011_00380 [Elusimicrobia bacterium]|nr:hypothetical protein [Elusimicrobiota bacterium]